MSEDLHRWARRSEYRLMSRDPMARIERMLRRSPRRVGRLEIPLWALGIIAISALQLRDGLDARPILGIAFSGAAALLAGRRR